MGTRFGGKAHAHLFYGMGAADIRAVGKRNLEWDLNDWKWDGDLFVASSLKPVHTGGSSAQFFPVMNGNSSNSSSSCSDEVNLGIENGKREIEKRRRVIDIEDDNMNDQGAGTLSLKLGGHGNPNREREMGNWEGNNGKKTKLVGGIANRAVCQVEDCGADLSNAKDYHRRHKVCQMHSKASKALVGNVMQRFCQQCSRFHVLQEFDEGKRSCRRRLAGHNKRRRKTNPDPVPNGSTSNDDQTSSYLLISLLKILSNMHSNRSDQLSDQDMLSHLLKSLASHTTENGGKNISGLLQEPRDSINDGSSERTGDANRANVAGVQTSMKPSIPVKMNNFDLNDVYVDLDGEAEDIERLPVPINLGASSRDCPLWLQQDSHQSSPPQNSGNSDSASAQSPSSSNGDVQCRTDRIIFKLFGKEPNDFPRVLRAQILDWLSHSPTDIESYIRPGCVILTIYLRQAEASWEELCCNLSASLSRLLDVSDDAFWRTGWVYVRVQNQIVFVCNGQVVVDRSLPQGNSNYSKLLSLKPIAIPGCERVEFVIKGVNLLQSTTRLLCAVEGKYMVQETSQELIDGVDNTKGHDEIQCINFCCSIPTVSGRGFIEIEDHGFSSSFFPFIVAEEEDVCTEICMLEDVLEFTETNTDSGIGKMEAKNEAMDFIHEMGWLLHRSQLKFRLGNLDPSGDLFPLRRFKWLVDFSMDREWCAVVKKLLNMLLSGVVGIGEHSSLDLALAEMCLLHRAVRKNSRSLVELLLTIVPEKSEIGNSLPVDGSHGNLLFRPDVAGPAGLTPLHIAAGKDGSEHVLDALTNDPAMVGIEAWKNARDSTGFTPEDYARLRGHYSYIHMVQKKINKRPAALGHVVVDIPDSSNNQVQKQTSSFEIIQKEIVPAQRSCKLCHQKPDYGTVGRSLLYRPAMLSMVAIAAVCVCVALLFKSCPEVVYMFRPFRWELLEYGTS